MSKWPNDFQAAHMSAVSGGSAIEGIRYKGKTLHEMSTAELIECCTHFHAAHVASVDNHAKALRRMAKLEEGYTGDEIANLDDWLKYHIRDPEKGDGTAKYINWRRWKRNERFGGLKPHYGKKDLSWE
jgi:hypothetical protein